MESLPTNIDMDCLRKSNVSCASSIGSSDGSNSKPSYTYEEARLRKTLIGAGGDLAVAATMDSGFEKSNTDTSAAGNGECDVVTKSVNFEIGQPMVEFEMSQNSLSNSRKTKRSTGYSSSKFTVDSEDDDDDIGVGTTVNDAEVYTAANNLLKQKSKGWCLSRNQTIVLTLFLIVSVVGLGILVLLLRTGQFAHDSHQAHVRAQLLQRRTDLTTRLSDLTAQVEISTEELERDTEQLEQETIELEPKQGVIEALKDAWFTLGVRERLERFKNTACCLVVCGCECLHLSDCLIGEFHKRFLGSYVPSGYRHFNFIDGHESHKLYTKLKVFSSDIWLDLFRGCASFWFRCECINNLLTHPHLVQGCPCYRADNSFSHFPELNVELKYKDFLPISKKFHELRTALESKQDFTDEELKNIDQDGREQLIEQYEKYCKDVERLGDVECTGGVVLLNQSTAVLENEVSNFRAYLGKTLTENNAICVPSKYAALKDYGTPANSAHLKDFSELTQLLRSLIQGQGENSYFEIQSQNGRFEEGPGLLHLIDFRKTGIQVNIKDYVVIDDGVSWGLVQHGFSRLQNGRREALKSRYADCVMIQEKETEVRAYYQFGGGFRTGQLEMAPFRWRLLHSAEVEKLAETATWRTALFCDVDFVGKALVPPNSDGIFGSESAETLGVPDFGSAILKPLKDSEEEQAMSTHCKRFRDIMKAHNNGWEICSSNGWEDRFLPEFSQDVIQRKSLFYIFNKNEFQQSQSTSFKSYLHHLEQTINLLLQGSNENTEPINIYKIKDFAEEDLEKVAFRRRLSWGWLAKAGLTLTSFVAWTVQCSCVVLLLPWCISTLCPDGLSHMWCVSKLFCMPDVETLIANSGEYYKNGSPLESNSDEADETEGSDDESADTAEAGDLRGSDRWSVDSVLPFANPWVKWCLGIASLQMCVCTVWRHHDRPLEPNVFSEFCRDNIIMRVILQMAFALGQLMNSK